MKGKIILGSLIVLFLALAIPNVSATYDICSGCHLSYVNAIRASGHANSDYCLDCHKGGYDTSTHNPGLNAVYIGYIVNQTTCYQGTCHSPTSGFAQRPVNESHGNHNHGQNYADCTQCHLANTTQKFPLNNSLYVHDHNFTVEYNFYNYNLYGMPLESDHSASKKGMFPYYTCTLTCHGTYKIEDEVIGWNQSKHAQSYEGQGDNNAYCAKCKSPTQYNLSVTYPTRYNYNISASDWKGIQCRICHNIHNDTYSGNGTPPIYIAFYNTTATLLTGNVVYDQVSNATVLCNNCHSNRNFAGVHIDTAGFDCANCHVNRTFSNYNHTFEVKNTTSGVEGCAVCHAAADHTWEQTSKHTNVECWACHDKTVVDNTTSGNATSSGNTFGIWQDPTTQNWTTYKIDSHGNAASWVLHNISLNVSCDKCHSANSTYNGTIGPTLTCSDCHTSYASAVNSSKHNQTLNASAPGCTGCHAGYEPSYGHTTGNNSLIVNMTTCKTCHIDGTTLMNNPEKHKSSPIDCTICHFANTTKTFSLNASLFTHDHNLTIEYNFYQYNQSGMPLRSNGGVGIGVFPYYTCTLACHGSGNQKIDEAANSWNQSNHARSLRMSGDNNAYCSKCKSPPNYNASDPDPRNTTIAASNWQGIQCRVCHNLHNRSFSNMSLGFSPKIPIAFYNATATSNKTTNPSGATIYDPVHNATELCEKCHSGNNGRNYAGFHKDTLGFDCANCHLNTTFNKNETHLLDVKNTTTGVTGCEVCHESNDHTFEFTANHTDKVTCEACHDKTVTRNATGYAYSSFGTSKKAGLYVDPATNLVSSWMGSVTSPSTWPLHNISKNVSCDKCHGTKSAVTDLLLAPTFGTIGCVKCHPSYASAVNNSMHNKTRNGAAPNCTDCHTGYDTNHTGYTGYIVNESNTCVNCHNSSVGGFEENHTGSISNPADCTQCHFANTTQTFTGFNSSLYTHDHNLTVEYNFYNYNLYGMPLESDHGASKKGMFPYYTCTLTCHNGTGGGQLKIENETSSWYQSRHARSLVEPPTDQANSCAKCKSPANYNVSVSSSALIPVADWQGVQCRVCHDMHNISYSNSTGGKPLAFYNATATSNITTNPSGTPIYDQVHNATELCEKCHTGTKHDSKYAGFHKDTLGFDCADCHANTTFNNATHLFEVKNTTSGATGCNVCHDATSVHSNFTEYSIHNSIVTCFACHDNTVARNSSDFVVNITSGLAAGIYKDPSTNYWTTYKVDGSAVTWPLHNISKSIDCNKCHGSRSVYNGSIAPNLTSGGITYYTTDTLISGYNFILVLLYPEPTIYANYLINSSLSAVPGVNKTLNWNSTSQEWEGYENINGVYFGTNFTITGYKAYFVRGSSSSVSKTYTFRGTN